MLYYKLEICNKIIIYDIHAGKKFRECYFYLFLFIFLLQMRTQQKMINLD